MGNYCGHLLHQGAWPTVDERQLYVGLLYHKQHCLENYIKVAIQASDLNPKKEEILRQATMPWMSEKTRRDVQFKKAALSNLMGRGIKFKNPPMGLKKRPKKPQSNPQPRKNKKYVSRKLKINKTPIDFKKQLDL